MNSLSISPTENSPLIDFSPDSGEMIIEGKCYPENTFDFFEPIVEWLKAYFESLAKKTCFHFKLTYFNSATTQVLFDILDLINEHAGPNIKVLWYYDPNNKNGYEDYEDYSEEYPDLGIEAVEK
jgi:hypothetical protein